MSQIVVQDVWPPRTPPEILGDPHLLRPNRCRVVQGWVCGCVEGGTSRSGRCCEGYKNILKQRLAENNRRKLLVSFRMLCALTVSCVEILQGSCDMENPSASECPAADWSDNGQGSVCNDIRVDGQWEHQRLREDAPGCKPVGAGRFFIRNLTTLASRSLMIGYLLQLGDVAKGLIYIHSQGMIHGDLKGVCFFTARVTFPSDRVYLPRPTY
jgi:hypothetical protein